ncbi:hypothetical protein DFH29DRAFT_944909 [Suillus ampliporus]|nr:hypothetical protein DFH29DRAFT_944909 [Suillus ampliporus]
MCSGPFRDLGGNLVGVRQQLQSSQNVLFQTFGILRKVSRGSSNLPGRMFVTGATGYTGRSVLSTLLSKSDTFQIAALIRSPEKVALFNSLGVTAVVGPNSDCEADVVLSCVHSELQTSEPEQSS